MTLRLIDGGRGDDEDDDSLAANPEPVREDTGYRPHVTEELRMKARPPGGPTRWAFVEVDESKPGPVAELGGPIGGPNMCAAKPKGCGLSAPVLHADPRSEDRRRTLCGTCTGAIMRERIGWGQAKDPEPTKGGRR